MTIARKTWFVIALFAMAVSQSASAVNIADDYWGNTPLVCDPAASACDVVGEPNDFDISSMDVSLSGDYLTVTINTNFSGAKNGTLDAYFGDLFLASAWTPDETDANYAADDNVTGTKWTYGFALDNRNVTSGLVSGTTVNGITTGDGDLYALTGSSNDANAYLSDDFFDAGYREGQEAVVDVGSLATVDGPASPIGAGTWETATGYITFVIDVSGTTLSMADGIALHWAMTCANDVIEGFVPAPGVLLLMAMGLFGVGASSKLRKRKLA